MLYDPIKKKIINLSIILIGILTLVCCCAAVKHVVLKEQKRKLEAQQAKEWLSVTGQHLDVRAIGSQ